MSLSYGGIGASGGTAVAFSGGRMLIRTSDGAFSEDVTPESGVPIMGPASDTGAGGCAPGGTNYFLSNFTADFDLSTHPAQIIGGKVTFNGVYGPTGTVAYFCPQVLDLISSESPIQVNVAPPPSCAVSPATNSVPPNASAVFSVTPNGVGPLTVSWSGPNGFISGPRQVTSTDTITITNVQSANAGVYTVTVTDVFGCSSVASATLLVNPIFSQFRVAGSNLILGGSGGRSNGGYVVLSATNVATAPWVAVSTNTFDATGQFIFTNTIDPSEGQRYFRLLLQ